MKRHFPILLSGAAGLAIAAAPALAQTTPSDAATTSTTAATASTPPETRGIQDIIVTAQRRSERLQDVPISVNVVGGDTLKTSGVSLSADLPTLVPALNFSHVAGAGTAFLRGIGSNAANPNDEPSVATYVDGVYIASPYANIMNLNNLERVEVLKGPQGTLFGRNATGGVIQLVTRTPSFAPTLEADVGYANYDTISGSVYASGGLGDVVAMDVAAMYSNQRNGWGRNLTVDADTFLSKSKSIRSKILISPSDAFSLTLAGDYSTIKANFADYRLPKGAIGADGVEAPANGYDTRGAITSFGDPFVPVIKNRQYGFSAKANGDMGFADLVTTFAYRHQDGYYYAEADATPLTLVEAKLPTYQANVSGELQLVSKKGSKLDWTLGGYYYSNKAGYKDLIFIVPSVPVPISATTLQSTESISGYVQATYEILPRLRITGGARYTDERQSMRGNVGLVGVLPNFGVSSGKRGYKEWTWRAAIDYGFTDDIHAYASFNRGVKGGGFDVLSIFNALGGAPVTSFDPEFLNAYEVGIKSKLLGNTLRLNVAGFYYDYTNIQVQVIPAGATSAGVVQTTNAAAATIKGIETDFEWRPFGGFALSGGAAYIHGRYDDFQNTVSYGNSAGVVVAPYDASGNPTVRPPKFTGNLTASYDFEGSFGKVTPSVTASYNSGFSFGSDNLLRNSGYTLLNASLQWRSEDDRFGVRVWGRNLLDKYYLAQGVPSALGALTTPAAPLTYGITLSTKFGG
ncbi:TonB-dependent receptor [Novosphingobium resinovorum]|uniref:TonB-dependent receptor n=1 Tax=Novosphingobium resinovorum TaxID=158500 RepID=UPI002ED3C138|nr:TonB-dependent receptor [Novosphingobium resinovorum]